MKLSKYEQETIITFNENEKEANVYTYNSNLKKKISALCQEQPEEAKQIADDERGGLTFEIPKKWIRVNASRVLSEAQKAVLEKMNIKRNA